MHYGTVIVCSRLREHPVNYDSFRILQINKIKIVMGEGGILWLVVKNI